MSKRPYLYSQIKKHLKLMHINFKASHKTFFTIRLKEHEGLPCLMMHFDKSFDRVSCYAIDGNYRFRYDFEAISVQMFLNKLLRFKLINRHHLNRLAA